MNWLWRILAFFGGLIAGHNSQTAADQSALQKESLNHEESKDKIQEHVAAESDAAVTDELRSWTHD